MKKSVLIAVCSVLSLSVFLSTGYTLKDTTVKAPTPDHAVIVTQPSEKPESKAPDTYAVKGLELIKKMDKLAGSKDYAEAMSYSKDLNTIVAKMGDADYSTPKSVYKTVLSDDAIAGYFKAMTGKTLSADILNMTKSRFIASIPSQLTAGNGAEELAAATIVTTSEAFVAPEITEQVIYVYLYDSEYSAIVTMTPGADGAVTATAGFIKSDIINADSAGDVAAMFEKDLEMHNLSFKKVTL